MARLRRKLPWVLLLGLILLVIVPSVHAPTNITFIQTTTVVSGAGGATTLSTSAFTDVTGDTLLVIIWAVGPFNSFVYSDSQVNTYSQKVASITSNPAGPSAFIAAATVATGGSNIVTVATGGSTRDYSIFAEEYRGVQGFGVTATNQNDAIANGATSYTSTLTFTSTAGSGSAIVETDYLFTTQTTPASVTYNNAQTQRQTASFNTILGTTAVSDDYAVAATSFSISDSWTWTTACPAPPACFDSHSGLELLGIQQQPITVVTQCYGNCGTPAVKLLNTNSTHLINFNQSITFFYEFQPTISGFLNNVTTSLAKSYSSNAFAPFLALYSSNCPVGQTPFTQQCPALQVVGGQTNSFSKGKTSIIGGINVAITSSPTIYYGVGLSTQFGPEDFNDTNTAVPIRLTAGLIPPTITQGGAGGPFDPNSHIGIWAWITGNIVGALPPPQPTQGICSGIIDCILPNLARSMCTNPTAACVSAGGLVELVGLVIAALYFVGKTAANTFPNAKLPMGELILFFGIIFAFLLSGAGVLFIWVPILIFFVVSLFMQKQTARYL